MAALLLRFGLLIGIIAVPFAGCAFSGKGQPVAVRSISGSSLELAWTCSEQGQGTTVSVLNTQSGENNIIHLETGISSHWVRDLEKGDYRIEIQEKHPQGAVKKLGSREIQVMSEKTSRLLTAEDFGLSKEDRLGLTTLIAIPEITKGNKAHLDAYRKAREELLVVSRTLTRFFVGPAFYIESENQIGTIEQVREYLRGSFPDLEIPHGYAATTLVAVDLRLPEPEKEIPCQLSLRLFEISDPNQYSGEFLWNRRPLLYEDFIEVPGFQVGKTSNYEVLIKAFQEGVVGMCLDSAVREYCKAVTGTGPRDRQFFERLQDTIGRTIGDEVEKGGSPDLSGTSHYAQVEGMIFPETKFEGVAATEESSAPEVKPVPAPEPETAATEEKQEEKPAKTGEEGNKPEEEEGAAEPEKKTDPATADPAAEPAKKPKEPAKKTFFNPKKGGKGKSKPDGTEPAKDPGKNAGKESGQ